MTIKIYLKKKTNLFSWNSCLSRASCSAVKAVLGLFSSAFFSALVFFVLRDRGPDRKRKDKLD